MKPLMVAVIAIGVLLGSRVCAQDISGSWEGRFVTGASPFENNGPFHSILKISKSGKGEWKAVYYANIAASKEPIPVTSITFADMHLTFAIDPFHLHYLGKLSPDAMSITGALNNSILDFRRALGVEFVVPEQLKQILTEANGTADEIVARKLYRLELMERLTVAEVSEGEAGLPGAQSRKALRALIDRSSFLGPPAAEIAAIAPPDMEAQRKMIALSVDYVTKTMHQLPNLYATRVTTSFARTVGEEQPMRPVGTYSAVVLYRDGKERHHSSLLHSGAPGLTTSGEFGTILDDALEDAANGNLAWERWEKGPEGTRAVFRYKVAAEQSHYQVERLFSAYEGEIAIDPLKGTVLRLIFRSDLAPPNPLLSGDILVEYGPVELGGKTYICPVRSVALSRDAQLQRLNDVVFEQYHLYHANARLVTGAESGP
jgi:hypothetical protein